MVRAGGDYSTGMAEAEAEARVVVAWSGGEAGLEVGVVGVVQVGGGARVSAAGARQLRAGGAEGVFGLAAVVYSKRATPR